VLVEHCQIKSSDYIKIAHMLSQSLLENTELKIPAGAAADKEAPLTEWAPNIEISMPKGSGED